MHYTAYLATLLPAVRHALANNLALGCGWVAVAARLHQQDPTTGQMLGTLALAHAALAAALGTLDPVADAVLPFAAATASGDDLPVRWADLVAGLDASVLTAWFQIATEAARDVVVETATDATLSQVQECLYAAVHALETIRGDVLGHS